MITLDILKTALLAEKPWIELDRLVRAEQALGRRVKEIYAELEALVEPARDAFQLTDVADDAMLDTLDALIGNCHPKCQYKDPPNNTLPSMEEIALIPRWARVAFAARCARRVLPLFRRFWPGAKDYSVGTVINDVELAEISAATAKPSASRGDVDAIQAGFDAARNRALGAQAVADAALYAARTAEIDVAHEFDTDSNTADAIKAAASAAEAANTEPIAININPFIRRDFDHLARLAEWQRWTDDTPVSPEVFGPLWPEGPPKGWPADPDVPQRADLPLELLSRARILEQMTEDEVVNLFNQINAYYIARTGTRLTMEDLRPLIAAAVLAEV